MFQVLAKYMRKISFFVQVQGLACNFTKKEIRQSYLLKILTTDLSRHFYSELLLGPAVF